LIYVETLTIIVGTIGMAKAGIIENMVLMLSLGRVHQTWKLMSLMKEYKD
jgi:hypothetical protein